MSRYASDTGGGREFRQAPAGNHVARCIEIIDLGTQAGEYLGEKTSKPQIIVRFELPFEREQFDTGEKPLLVSKYYTNSLNEKSTLHRDLTSWRGREFSPEELFSFDLMNILDKPCTVSIVHTEKGKAKIVSISGLPKGTTCPPAFNKPKAFWLDADAFSYEAFTLLPQAFQKQIMLSPEFQKVSKGFESPEQRMGMPETVIDDEIPF